MSHHPQIVPSNTSLSDASRIMAERNVGTLLVADPLKIKEGVRPNDLLGIVTDRDIVVRCVAQSRDPDLYTVSQAMSCPVFWCLENDPIMDAVDKMQNLGVRRLAVFTGETEQLSGFLSTDDISEEDKAA